MYMYYRCISYTYYFRPSEALGANGARMTGRPGLGGFEIRIL